jgi:hypothetical protein
MARPVKKQPNQTEMWLTFQDSIGRHILYFERIRS